MALKIGGRTTVHLPVSGESLHELAGSARKPPRSARATRYRTKLGVLTGQVLVGVAILGLWQLTVSLGLIDRLVSRSPGQVFSFLITIAKAGKLMPALMSTLSATLIAFVLASVVGVVVGIGLGLFPRVERLVEPYLNAVNAMPRIAFAPIFVLYFGIGQSAKIALGFSIVVFILILNARAGIRNVEADVLTMTNVMGISKWQLFWKVLLPSAVPSIFAGLRLGLIYALLGVITSEIVAARLGLGQLISSYAGTFQIEGVYAIVLVLAVLAAVLNALMARIERAILRRQGREIQA